MKKLLFIGMILMTLTGCTNFYDVLISGGEVIDGSGKDRYKADVGIIGDKIVAIGDLSGKEANVKIDATGNQKDFNRSVGGCDNLLGRAGDLDDGDGGCKGSRFHHQHQLIAVGGECLAHGHREDDATEQQESRHTDGTGGFKLDPGNGLDAAADDFAGISGSIEHQCKNSTKPGLFQQNPKPDLLKEDPELA